MRGDSLGRDMADMAVSTVEDGKMHGYAIGSRNISTLPATGREGKEEVIHSMLTTPLFALAEMQGGRVGATYPCRRGTFEQTTLHRILLDKPNSSQRE